MPPMELIWFGVVILAVIGEAATSSLVSIWFAGGAIAALVAALLGAQLWLQIVLFLVVSIVILAAARPLAKKYIYSRKQATNIDRLIGMTCRVTEAIDNSVGHGTVFVDGKPWSARSESDGEIAEGETVEILRIEGVKLIVRPKEKVQK